MCEASGRLGTNGRCDEEDSSASPEDCCLCLRCPPQMFTAVLLGILACVLVTGGVFLAFHKWDHAWLLVSAVGIVLMAIGTALHCCSSPPRKGHSCKSGCGGRGPPDVGGPAGPLTEQLLPLSNARSVSQLSLNMVPGYFPPMVLPGGPHNGYGLEQHSAAVQNISRLVQHQQQLHLQQPNVEGGKGGFLLLSLPAGDTSPASIQSLVAAVYQLDNSVPTESGRDPVATDVSSQTTEVSFVSRTDNASVTVSQVPLEPSTSSAASQPVRKHAEVQTCDEWPVIPAQPDIAGDIQTTSTSASQTTNMAVDVEILRTEETVQATCANIVEMPSVVQESHNNNLVCDSAEVQTDSHIPTSIEVNCLVTVEEDVTLIVSEPATSVENSSVVEIPQTASPEVGRHSNTEVPLSDHSQESEGDVVDSRNTNDTSDRTETEDSPELEIFPSSSSQTQQIPTAMDFDIPSSIDDLSDSEDSELLERSSPPPSYEDVTQETPVTPVGAFGLAYGTI